MFRPFYFLKVSGASNLVFPPLPVASNFIDMSNSVLKSLSRYWLLLPWVLFAQEVPLLQPKLIPFAQLNLGASYASLTPNQNLLLKTTAGGWKEANPLTVIASNMEIELLRYRWGSYFLKSPRMDAYSSFAFTYFGQLGSETLPAAYPTSYLLNESVVTDFSLNLLIKEYALNHTFIYQYAQRSAIQASLGTGLAHLSLLKNEDGLRILESNGLGLHFGLGWKYRILGRPGNRLLIGVDLGYSLRLFDVSPEQEGLALSNGSTNNVSFIEGLTLHTADFRVNLDLGEMLFAAYTPYRDPIRLGLINVGMGYGLLSYTDGDNIQYDSTGTHLTVGFNGRLNRNLDIQLIKYNWPFHLARQANIDLFSGLGLRFWKSSVRTSLPADWATTLTDGSAVFEGLRFSPRILDIYLNHEILYPLSEKFHLRVNGGTGFATLTLYENELLERLIDASGISWQLGSQIGYTIRGDGSSKVALGAGFHYYHQAFDIDMNASNLTPLTPGKRIPINHVDLSGLVVSLEIGLVFGGSPNAAHKALTLFQQKKFTRALEVQDELLQMNPEHHNREALAIQRRMIQDSLTTYYYRDARTILDKGRIETALALINRGGKPPSEEGIQAIQSMRIEIADEALSRARLALQNLDHEEAEKNILLALKADPTVLEVAKVLLSRSYIIRATLLYQAGVYNRSLYWLKQADGMSDRYRIVTKNLRQKIGDGRLEDANEGILKEDPQMVLESMQDAKAFNPSLGDIVDDHLKDLQAAIRHMEEQTIAPLKRMALDNILDDVEGLSPDNFEPKIGMKGSLITRYVGQPERQFTEDNYDLWVYPRGDELEIWLFLKDGIIEKIEYQPRN
jgi:tetratricopeptide (TPR) repeat protein